jgi:hypothetical protein
MVSGQEVNGGIAGQTVRDCNSSYCCLMTVDYLTP